MLILERLFSISFGKPKIHTAASARLAALPDHVLEVSDSLRKIAAHAVAPVTLRPRAVNGEDQAIQESFAGNRRDGRRGEYQAVGAVGNENIRAAPLDFPEERDRIPVQEGFAKIVEQDCAAGSRLH